MSLRRVQALACAHSESHGSAEGASRRLRRGATNARAFRGRWSATRAWRLIAALSALLLTGLTSTTSDALAVSPGPDTGPPATTGTEFWFAFGANAEEGVNYVDVSSTTSTIAVVEVPSLEFSDEIKVTPGEASPVQLPSGADLDMADGIERLAVHVTSTSPVSVYGLEDTPASSDGFTALPVTAIGTDYYALGYEALPGEMPQSLPSELQIVGTQPATTITITPSANTASRESGVPYTVTLNAGETYQLIGQPGADLTGTHITSSAPVSVLAGAQCADIPNLEYPYCNYIAEQMPPTTLWGVSFLAEPLATRKKGDTFRVLAATDGTTVSINGTVEGTLEAGHFYQMQLTEVSEIATNHPVLVAQYSDSSFFDGVEGDPSEMLVPPSDEFLQSYTYATPPERFTNYVNVIAPSADTGAVALDGSPIPSAGFSPIGASGSSGAKISVLPGTHTLTSPQAFGLTAYGFAPYDAYSYTGGYGLHEGKHEPSSATTTSTPSSTPEPPPPPPPAPPAVQAPQLAETGNVAPVSGQVGVRLPGTTEFVPLSSLRQIPFGTEIEATHGRVSVTVAGPHGGTQTAEYFEGEFVLTQGHDGLVVAMLAGGSFASCPTARRRDHHARASAKHASAKHAVRKLWTNAHGTFSTKGRYAVTTVEGTEWLTEDLCEGTLVHVTRDKVAVTNLVNHRHVTVTTGHTYLVRA